MTSSDPTPRGLGRRRWLLAAPAAVVLGWVAQRGWTARAPLEEGPAFASLLGRRIDRWTIVRVHPLHLGAVPIVLSTDDGQRYQVDVLARDPDGPSGVAQTAALSLFVVNSRHQPGRDGDRRTDEAQGLGAMVLAQVLRDEPAPAGLLTLEQRRERHPRGAFAVSLS